MKFNVAFKHIWWGILLFGCLLLLGQRFHIIQKGPLSDYDVVVVGLLVLIALMPFFSELSFLGFSIKKDMTEFKREVKDDILDLKYEVTNVMNNNANANINFDLNVPIPDEELSTLEEEYKAILNQSLPESDARNSFNFDVPRETSLFFEARYSIEQELRRLWNNHFNEDNFTSYTINKIIQKLAQNKIVPNNLAQIIKEVYSICTPAICGEKPSKNQFAFIKEVVPGLLAVLKEVD